MGRYPKAMDVVAAKKGTARKGAGPRKKAMAAAQMSTLTGSGVRFQYVGIVNVTFIISRDGDYSETEALRLYWDNAQSGWYMELDFKEIVKVPKTWCLS
jgi:hypothetical protein